MCCFSNDSWSGPGGSKSRLAEAAGAGVMSSEKN